MTLSLPEQSTWHLCSRCGHTTGAHRLYDPEMGGYKRCADCVGNHYSNQPDLRGCRGHVPRLCPNCLHPLSTHVIIGKPKTVVCTISECGCDVPFTLTDTEIERNEMKYMVIKCELSEWDDQRLNEGIVTVTLMDQEANGQITLRLPVNESGIHGVYGLPTLGQIVDIGPMLRAMEGGNKKAD